MHARETSGFVALALAGVGALAACGALVGLEPYEASDAGAAGGDARSSDATSGDAASPDASADGAPHARACRPDAPFGAPERVDVALPSTNGVNTIESAHLVPAAGVAYLAICPSQSPKFPCNLFRGAFDGANGVTGLASLAVDDGSYTAFPRVTPDGASLMFVSDRGSGEYHLFTWAIDGAGPATRVDLVAGAHGESEPFFSADGKTLYVSETLSTPDIYRASVNGTTYTGATLIAELSDPSHSDYAPVATDDELEIFWGSDRQGSIDVFSATRGAKDGAFSGVQPLGSSINGPGNEWPVWISPDACALYYVHQPDADASTVQQLWVTRRAP